jgi:hypothetical protein
MTREFNRRSVLLGSAAGVGATLSAGLIGGGTPAFASPRVTRAPGVIGVATDPMNEVGFQLVQTLVGTELACRRTYDHTGGAFPQNWATCAAASDYGKRVSVWSATPDMAALANGSLDSKVTAFLNSIPRGHTTYLTVFHEFDDKIHKGQYTLAQWAPAFRRFCDLVHATNRHELRTYLCPTTNWWDWGIGPSPDEYWPGTSLNSYVDILGADSYNNYKPGKKWKSPATMLDPVKDMAAAKNVRWGVSEIGCEEDPADGSRKPEWIGQLGDVVDSNCAYIAYFNLPGTTGTVVRLLNSSLSTTSAFKSMAKAHNAGWRGRT